MITKGDSKGVGQDMGASPVVSSFLYRREFLDDDTPLNKEAYVLHRGKGYTAFVPWSLLRKWVVVTPAVNAQFEAYAKKHPQSLGVMLTKMVLLPEPFYLVHQDRFARPDNVGVEEIVKSRDYLPRVTQSLYGLMVGLENPDAATRGKAVEAVVAALVAWSTLRRQIDVTPFDYHLNLIVENQILPRLRAKLPSLASGAREILEAAIAATQSAATRLFSAPATSFVNLPLGESFEESESKYWRCSVDASEYTSLASLNEPVVGPAAEIFIFPWLVMGAGVPILIVPDALDSEFGDGREFEGDFLDHISKFAQDRFVKVWGEAMLPSTLHTDLYMLRACQKADNVHLFRDFMPVVMNTAWPDCSLVDIYYNMVRRLQAVFIERLSSYVAMNASDLGLFLLDGEAKNTALASWRKQANWASVMGHGPRDSGIPVVVMVKDILRYERDVWVDPKGVGGGKYIPLTYKYTTALGGYARTFQNQRVSVTFDSLKVFPENVTGFRTALSNEMGGVCVNPVASVSMKSSSAKAMFYTVLGNKMFDGSIPHVEWDVDGDGFRCPMNHLDYLGRKCVLADFDKCDQCVSAGGFATPWTRNLNESHQVLSEVAKNFKVNTSS